MADALEVGDQGGQPRADQAARLDVAGQGGLVGPLRSAAHQYSGQVCCSTVNLAGCEIDLLDDPGERRRCRRRRPAAAGAAVEGVVEEGVDLLRGERARSCLGWPGWPPTLAFVLAGQAAEAGAA